MDAGRIAVCFHESYLGGATRSIERIVPLLRDAGWEFSFWVPRPSELYDELAGRGWDVDGEPRCFEYSLRTWWLAPGPRNRLAAMPAYVRRFRDFLERRRPALVHANSVLTLAEALIAARRGHAVLLHSHEMLPRDLRGRLLRRTTWRYLDQVVAVSRASARAISRNGHGPRIVYEAAPVPPAPVTARAEPRPFAVGTVAVVSKRKGSDLFVSAAELLRSRARREFRFEMVGAAAEEVDAAWASGVISDARRVGVTHLPSADVFERLAEWDAFVLPSRADPFPIAMLEVMASGLPAIGARRDGIVEQLVPGSGLLVEPEDPRALADAIEWLASQGAEVRARLGRRARARVADNFTLADQAAAMDEAYRTTLDAARHRQHASATLASAVAH